MSDFPIKVSWQLKKTPWLKGLKHFQGGCILTNTSQHLPTPANFYQEERHYQPNYQSIYQSLHPCLLRRPKCPNKSRRESWMREKSPGLQPLMSWLVLSREQGNESPIGQYEGWFPHSLVGTSQWVNLSYLLLLPNPIAFCTVGVQRNLSKSDVFKCNWGIVAGTSEKGVCVGPHHWLSFLLLTYFGTLDWIGTMQGMLTKMAIGHLRQARGCCSIEPNMKCMKCPSRDVDWNLLESDSCLALKQEASALKHTPSLTQICGSNSESWASRADFQSSWQKWRSCKSMTISLQIERKLILKAAIVTPFYNVCAGGEEGCGTHFLELSIFNLVESKHAFSRWEGA